MRTSPIDEYKLLISHHTKEDFDRTLQIKILKNNIHICTRCLGILLGFLIASSQPLLLPNSLYILFILPYFALFDWLLNQIGLWSGNNYTRLSSGLLLGAGIIWYYHVFLINSLSPVIIINFLVFSIIILFKDIIFKIRVNS